MGTGGLKQLVNKFKIQILNLKFMSYYSPHYLNSLVTIQIRGTIQNTGYYLNSEYEQRESTHEGVAQAPKYLYYARH